MLIIRGERMRGNSCMRIAFYGLPGVGKSTTSRILHHELTRREWPVVQVRLAAPLYELQAEIWRRAARPLADEHVQDREILSFLGRTLRRINPDALTDEFRRRVLEVSAHGDTAVVCDDMRQIDAPELISLGFKLVRITAPDSVRRARLAARGDIGAQKEDANFEAMENLTAWRMLTNDGSIDQLRTHVSALVEEAMSL